MTTRINIKAGFLLLFVLTISGAIGQQFPFEFWHEGKVVLETQDTLKGKVKYDPQNDLIQLERNGRFETFTSRKAVFYEIFDQGLNNYRQFYALPYSVNGGYKTPVFFELLTEGKLTLLSRETLEYRNTSAGYFYGSVTRLVLVHKYFLLDEDGGINAVIGDKNDFLAMMDSRQEEVRKYIKANRLNLERRPDIVRAIAYYNALFRQ